MKIFMLLILLSSAAHADISIKMLEAERPFIRFPETTPEERQDIADQAYLVYSQLYSHADEKIKTYGPSADLTLDLARMRVKAQTISTDELHKSLSDIYSRLHDIHTTYPFPTPYSCYEARLPFAVERAKDEKNNWVVAVTALRNNSFVQSQFPEITKISVGDVLVSIGGMSALDKAKTLKDTCRGAAVDPSWRRALACLTSHYGATTLMPEENETTAVFKKRDGTIVEVNAPWFVLKDEDCVTKSETIVEKKNESSLKMGLTPPQPKYFPVFPPRRVNNDPSIRWETYTNDNGSFGYIHILSFNPGQDPKAMISGMATLLETELANTNGLIIDVRENQGGLLSYAEGLTQLFTPNRVSAQNFVIRATKTIEWFFDHTLLQVNPWKKAVHEARAKGAKTSALIPLSSTYDLQKYGQSYFKPVVVVTNALCYSACDAFTASMKDSGAALIVGEDTQTGGGGANKIRMNWLASHLPQELSGLFKVLPHNQEFGLAWRSNYRTVDGRPIEDQGVQSDIIVPVSLNDLGTNDSVQMKAFSDILVQEKKNNPLKYSSSVETSNSARLLLHKGKENFVTLKVSGTDRLTLVTQGREVDSLLIKEKNGEVKFSLQKLEKLAQNYGSFFLLGYNQGRLVWKKSWDYFYAAPVFKPKSSLSLMNQLSRSTVLYAWGGLRGIPDTIWNFEKDGIQLWNSAGYDSQTNAFASLFVDLTTCKEAKLQFTLDLNTEVSSDFFSVQARTENNSIILLNSLSGDQKNALMTLDLSAVITDKTEIRFNFDSDEWVSGTGVKVKNLKLICH